MKYFKNRVAVKSITGIVLLLVVFSVIVSAIGFNGFTDALLKQYSDGAFRTADIAVQLINTERMNAYWQSNGVTKEYTEVWTQMDRLCNSSGATFIYVIEPDLSDYAHIRFLFSTINHDSPYSIYDFGYLRETTNDEYKAKYHALYFEGSKQELVIRDKGYIETDPHITAMVPLKDAEGKTVGILCVQRQMDVLVQARKTFLRKVGAALVALALLVIAGQGVYLHLVLLRPVRKIVNETSRFAAENVANAKKLRDSIKNQDEIGLLAQSIDQMEEKIENTMKDLTRVTAEKERIGTELLLATQIQAAMLPHIFPPFPERTEFDLYASMDPAKEVGGDFYDYFLIDDDHLCLVMADVSGKGVPGALFMMASKIILDSVAMLGRSPAEILAKTNEAICSNNEAQMFVTVWLGILEISTGTLTAANAGHEYPVLMRPDGQFELFKDKHGFVLGGIDGAKYREYTLRLESGTKLFLYTDGVPEAANKDNELFGTDRMLAALNTDTKAEPKRVLANVRAAVDGFVQGAEQFDDLTMLCLEYKSARPEEYDELEIEATDDNLATVLGFIEERLEKADCPMKAQMQLCIAAEEIFVNIAHYAYAPNTGMAKLRVKMSEAPRAVTITFIDRGIPYDPLAAADPDVTRPAEARDIGGLGVFMTKKFVDDIRYEYVDGQNVLTMMRQF